MLHYQETLGYSHRTLHSQKMAPRSARQSGQKSTHTKDDDVEFKELGHEIERVKAELKKNSQECLKAAESTLRDIQSPLVQQRRALQSQLEIAMHQYVEKDELSMVRRIQRQAVDSGFVIRATALLNLGECPLCLDNIPEPTVDDCLTHRSHACCGVISCIPCSDKHEQAFQKAQKARDQARRESNVIEYRARCAEWESLLRCPFCRADWPTMLTIHQLELKNAQAGKVWAQIGLAQRLRQGYGVPKDHHAAIHWYTLAAQQDPHGDAQAALARAWLEGEGGVPEKSQDKAWELAFPAARNGNAAAQYVCAKIAANRNQALESWRWYTLSAAQGYPGSLFEVGNVYLEGCAKLYMPKDLFQAHFWLRKAALQEEPNAQLACASW
jgi:Sel1 repeat